MSGPGIFLKRAPKAGDKPSSLQVGEIGINEFDGKLFMRNPAGGVQEFDLNSGGSGLSNLNSLVIGQAGAGKVKLVSGDADHAGRIEFYRASGVRLGYIGYYDDAVGINTTVPLKYNSSEIVNEARLQQAVLSQSTSNNEPAISDPLLFTANNSQLFSHGLPSGGFLRSQILLKCISAVDGFKVGDVFNYRDHTFLNVTDLKNGTVRLNSKFNQPHYIVSPTNTYHNITAHHYRWRAIIILERVA